MFEGDADVLLLCGLFLGWLILAVSCKNNSGVVKTFIQHSHANGYFSRARKNDL
jgi:hypothetical protein